MTSRSPVTHLAWHVIVPSIQARDRQVRRARFSVLRRRATADSDDTRRPEAPFLSGYVAPSSPVSAALVS